MITKADQGAQPDRTNILVGLGVLIVAVAMYLKTVAPTISFWDCGEFVATSVIFGIPHPPGSPVFTIIGRVFAVIPFAQDLAYRVNLVSALSSAASVFLAYLITTRIIGYWYDGKGSTWDRIGMYVGGVVGSLCMAFNRTFWTNAVEAEVYGLTMVVFMLVFYLLLIWHSRHEKSSADRILLLIVYLAVLGSGIHMSAYVIMPAGLIFAMMVDKRLRTDLRFWILSILLLTILLNLKWFLFGVAGWLAISLVLSLAMRRDRQWQLSAALAFVALLAFSIQSYVPMRSKFDPAIDMNDPESFDKLVSFLEREQYGSENMVSRSFDRRGEMANQFGDFPRMGFWRFFSEQYSKPGIAFFLFFVIGLYGIYTATRKRWDVGGLVFLLVLAGTIGLTWYMNFADGTQIEASTMAKRLEVRDRDYFWTVGFAVFGICIGLGAAGILRSVRGAIGPSGGLRKPVSVVLAAIMLLMPVVGIAHNYRACDRTYDTMPFDYAYNVLNTCEEGAILFTAGDNDTFPVWALQYGLGIRPDVRVVNLSLLDTDWYAIQMRDNLDVPISLTDPQLIQVPTEVRGRTFPLPTEKYYDPLRKVNRLLVTFPDENGRIIRVAHQLTENILLNNNWEYPIYFANFPPEEVGFDLRQHSERVGILYRITRENKAGALNIDDTYRLFKEVYQMRNLDNPKYYRDETATTMALGMAQKYWDLYTELRAANDTVRAPEVFLDLDSKVPEYWQCAVEHAAMDSIFGIQGKTHEEYLEEYLAFVDELLRYAPDSFYYLQYKGIILQDLGRSEESLVYLKEAFEMMPTSSMTYRSLVTAYIQAGMNAEAIEISRRYLFLNPLDDAARRIVQAYSGG